MAAFNPQISTNLGDNYTTRSQGRTPNKALGYLFEGLAGAVSSMKTNAAEAAKAKAKQDEMNLGNDIGAGTDSMVGSTLFPQEPSLVSNRPGSMPKYGSHLVDPGTMQEVDSSVSQLQKNRQSLLQGNMDQVQFDMKRQEMMQRLHSKYPQYSQTYIEQKIDEALGHSASVQYMKDLQAMRDKEASMVSDEDKRRGALVNSWSEKGYITNGEVQADYKNLTGSAFNKGNFSEEAMQIAISRHVDLAAVQASDLANLSFMKATDEAKSLVAEQSATSNMQELSHKLLYTVLNSDRQKIEELARLGKDISPEQTAQLTALISETEQNVHIALDAFWARQYKDGKTYVDYIRNPEKRAAIDKIVLDRVETLKGLVSNKDFGVISSVANYQNALKTRKDLRLFLERGDIVENIDLFDKMHGAGSAAKIIGVDKAVLNTMTPGQRAVHDTEVMKLVGGKYTAQEILDEIKWTKGLDKKDGEAVFRALQHAVQFGVSGDMNKQDMASFFKTMVFNPQGTGILSGMQDPKRVYQLFVNPVVTNALKGTDAWDEYRNFAYKQAFPILHELGGIIVDTQRNTYRNVVSYDEKTGHFSLVQKEGAGPVDEMLSSGGPAAVQQMNGYVDSIKPILDAEGLSVDRFLGVALSSMEFRNVQKEGSFLQRSYQAVKKFMQDNPSDLSPNGPRPHATEGRVKEITKERQNAPVTPLDTGGPHQSIEGHQGRLPEQTRTGNPIMDLISKAEGADFNTMFGGGKHDLTNMSVQEVLQLQKQNVKSKGGSPAGAVQVTADTLKGLIKQGVVSLTDTFNARTQEKIAHALLVRRGYNDFISGKISAEKFADNIAHEWASLPLASGLSAYQGKAGNKARISREELMQMIDNLIQ